jgi:hypothetical protein
MASLGAAWRGWRDLSPHAADVALALALTLLVVVESAVGASWGPFSRPDAANPAGDGHGEAIALALLVTLLVLVLHMVVLHRLARR